MAGIYVNIKGSGLNGKPSGSALKSGIAYTKALCNELTYYAPTHGQNETIEAIHFGGSPDIIREEGIRTTMGTLFSSYDALHVNECSINLTPPLFDKQSLQGLAALGFNTVEIYAGSFFESDLAKLNLPHAPEDIHRVVKECRQVGIHNISIALNIDIANQPAEYWAANLEKAISLDIQQVSLKGMPVYNHEDMPAQLAECFSYPSDKLEQMDRYSFAAAYLGDFGLEHYVLSAFARPGHRSKQRDLQMIHSNILGIGPGAHSFWWVAGSHSHANRWSNVDNIERYKALVNQKELPLESRSMLDLDTLANEYTFLRIQHPDGLDLTKLESNYGVDLLTERIEELAWLESEGYIDPIRNNRVRLSQYGKTHCRDAFMRLLV